MILSYLKSHKSRLILFGILSVTIFLYAKSISYDFYFDDYRIEKNTFLENSYDFGKAFKKDANRPFGVFVWVILSFLWGITPLPYHLLAIIMHLLCGIAVYVACCEVFKNTAIRVKGDPRFFSLLVTSVFLVHPLQTESVVYPVQSTSVLPMALFCLICISAYIRYRSTAKKKYLGIIVFFSILASLSRETAIVIPSLLFLIEFLLLQRGNFRHSFKYWYLHCIHFFLSICIFLSCAAFYADKGVALYARNGHGLSLDGVTPLLYLGTQFRVIVRYIFLFFIPIGQNFDYDFPAYLTLYSPSVVLSFLLLSVFFTYTVRIRKKRPLFTFGVFWFFLFLAPTSSIVPIRDVIFEHRLYLPLVGAIITMCSFFICVDNKAENRGFPFLILIGILCMFGVLTTFRIRVWKNKVSIWTDVIKKSPKKSRGYNNRGLAYNSMGRYLDAISDFSMAVLLKADLTQAYNNRGLAYFELKNYSKALSNYTKAISINSEFYEYYYNRGLVYQKLGSHKKAVLDFSTVIKKDKDYKKAYFNRANSYTALSNYEKALFDIEKAVILDPNYEDAYNERGNIYVHLGKFDKAIKEYTRAIKIQHESWEFFSNRALAYLRVGNYDLAKKDFDSALAINPKNSKLYDNRGNIYYLNGKYQLALRDYNSSLKLNANNAVVYYNRANLYKTLGRLSEARDDYKLVINSYLKDADVYFRLGQVYSLLGETKNANINFKRAEEFLRDRQ